MKTIDEILNTLMLIHPHHCCDNDGDDETFMKTLPCRSNSDAKLDLLDHGASCLTGATILDVCLTSGERFACKESDGAGY